MTIESFDFESSTRAHFSFLEKKFGFHVVGHDATAVRYESDIVFVDVSCELLAVDVAEISVAIGLMDQSRRDRTGYGINHLIRLAGQNVGKWHHWPTARTKSECDAGLEKLANELWMYGSRALQGDVSIFDAMFAASEMASEKDRANFLRPSAEAAFREKAYSKAVELYESMNGFRTPAEEQKLAYARKHCVK